MDSVDLVARENEFKKLNKQLEKKTERLMKEIEEVMQKPDIFSTPKIRLNLSNSSTPARHYCDTPKPSPLSNNGASKSRDIHKTSTSLRKNQNQNTKTRKSVATSSNCASDDEHTQNSESSADVCAKRVVCDCCVEKNSDNMEFLYAFVSVNVKDKVLPQTFLKGKVTVESVCKCLSAKIKLMQEQIDRLQATIENKKQQCEAHLARTAELEGERMSLLSAVNTMKSDTADMKAKYLAAQNRLIEKERLYKEQRSLADRLTVEVKQHATRLSGAEARSAAREETIAGLKQQLAAAEMAAKEYRDSTRSLSASHEATIRQLEAKQRALRARDAQQRALVDNLRAQRTLLSGRSDARALSAQYQQLLEAEY